MRTLPKSEETLLRVRQVVQEATDADDTAFLEGLSKIELIDMILCSCSFIYGFKVFLNHLGIDGESIIGSLFTQIDLGD